MKPFLNKPWFLRVQYKSFENIVGKGFADDNFEFNENGRKFFKWTENTARNEQFLLFPQCFYSIR